MVRSIRRRIEASQVSVRIACNEANIHHKQFLSWTKDFNAMQQAMNIKAKSLCLGRLSILKPIEYELLRFISELVEQGMGVTTLMVMLKAASLSRDYWEKSRIAQYNSARRFIKSNGLVHRMATHESQRDPRTVAAEALDVAQSAWVKLDQPCRPHQDFIHYQNEPNANYLQLQCKEDIGACGAPNCPCEEVRM